MSAPSFTPQLRPLSVGEALDAGFRLFRHRFGTLVVCVVAPIVPFAILSTLIQASIDPDAFDVNAPTSSTDSGTALAGIFLSGLVLQAAATLAIGACFKAISAAYVGERAGAGDSLRYALGRVIPLILAYIVFVILLIPAFIALIIPGIWVAVKLSMMFPAVVFERAGPFKAVGRSWSLTRGAWWRTFGTLLVIVLITYVLQLVLGGIIGGIAGASGDISEAGFAVVVTLVNVISLVLTYPLIAAVTTVIYYDLRVRNEGFDLQLLAQGVGGDASRFASAPERPEAPVPPPPAPAEGGGGFAPPGERTPGS